MDNSKNEKEERGIREDNSKGMNTKKAIKFLKGFFETGIYTKIRNEIIDLLKRGDKKDKNFPLTTEEILSEEAHTIKVGICPICKTENDVFFVELIKHHICYRPKYTILICRSCHQKCHQQVTQIGGGI